MFNPSRLSTFRSVPLGYRSKQIYLEFCTYMLDKYNKGSFWSKNNMGVSLIEMERLAEKATNPRGKEIWEEFSKDLTVGKEVLHHYMASSYQGWDKDSSLIFWRWPSTMCREARDGIP